MLILPALCNAVECSLQIDAVAPPHECCPRDSQPASHEKQPSKSNAAGCPYFFLDKIKKTAIYVVAAPPPQWSLLPSIAAVADTAAPSVRLADRSQTYLFNRVLLL